MSGGRQVKGNSVARRGKWHGKERKRCSKERGMAWREMEEWHGMRGGAAWRGECKWHGRGGGMAWWEDGELCGMSAVFERQHGTAVSQWIVMAWQGKDVVQHGSGFQVKTWHGIVIMAMATAWQGISALSTWQRHEGYSGMQGKEGRGG